MGRGAGCPVSPDDANDITITLTRGDWAKDGPYHGLYRDRLKLNLQSQQRFIGYTHRTVHLTYSGLPLICTVCSLLIIAAKFTVDRGRGHHHHTLVAFASGDITLMSNHPSPRVNSLL